ncbi:MAG: TetR/AcrR family transcriptional regulator [Bacteroidia bacterium]
MTESKDIWIKKGYETFALGGATGLKIESLSRKVGVSKSSFYHHFADLEIFIGFLLKHHISQSCIMAEKELNAKNINPDLIDILAEHKIDLLFNRQLRINREIQSFADTLSESNKIVGDGFVLVWVKDLNLQFTQKQLAAFFELALENFYLQINSENLNHQWLSDYFANLKRIANSFA